MAFALEKYKNSKRLRRGGLIAPFAKVAIERDGARLRLNIKAIRELYKINKDLNFIDYQINLNGQQVKLLPVKREKNKESMQILSTWLDRDFFAPYQGKDYQLYFCGGGLCFDVEKEI